MQTAQYWLVNTAVSLGVSLDKPYGNTRFRTGCWKEDHGVIYVVFFLSLVFHWSASVPWPMGFCSSAFWAAAGKPDPAPMEQPSFESRSGGRCQGQSDQVWCQAAAGSSSAAPGAQLSLQTRLRQLIVLGGGKWGWGICRRLKAGFSTQQVLFNAIIWETFPFKVLNLLCITSSRVPCSIHFPDDLSFILHSYQ